MRSARQDPKLHETLGEYMAPARVVAQFREGTGEKTRFLCAANVDDLIQIGQFQGNIDVSFQIKESKG